MIIKRVRNVYQSGGVLAVLRAIVRRARTPHAASYAAARGLVRDRLGLEIGGPSPIFARGGLLPLYQHAARIDNCNFAAQTIWEGQIDESAALTFRAARGPGRQYIAEAGHLPMIASESYDFVLSSHMLEHTANPLRALAEWKRVLRPDGMLLIIVPHRDGTFDHRRPLTTLAHLQDDFAMDRGEDDTTHVDEVLALHDVSRDPGVEGREAFRERVARNLQLRSVHHHVFNLKLVVDAVQAAGLIAVRAEALEPYHIVVLAVRETREGSVRLDEAALAGAMACSPFASDRS